MQQRNNRRYFVLASVVLLGLATLMIGIDAQAQIAFVSDRDGNEEIYVMDTDGKNQQNLTKDSLSDFDPSWSPDGKRIAFASLSNKNWDIYVMDLAGGNFQQLTDNRHSDWEPSWSPDGRHIAFTAVPKGEDMEIYVMTADGGIPRQLTKNHHVDREPSWAPDGKRIAFASDREGNWDIYVMDIDGKNQQNLTNSPIMRDSHPTWFSPAFSVAPVDKQFTIWAWLKQVVR